MNYCHESEWFPDEQNVYEGQPALTSGDVSCYESPSICVSITGPSIIKFAWKKSSNTSKSLSDYTNYSCYIDGIKKEECYSTSWKEVLLPIGSGLHKIRWEFRIDKYPNGRCPAYAHGTGWLAYPIETPTNVTSSPPEINISYNKTPANITLVPPKASVNVLHCCSHINLIMIPSTKKAEVDQKITYNYTIYSDGQRPLKDIHLYDSKIKDIKIQGDTSKMEKLDPDEKVSASGNYTISDSDLPGPFNNAASAVGEDAFTYEERRANASTSVGILPSDLNISMSANLSSIGNLSDRINLTINVANNGPGKAAGIVLHDMISDNAEFIRAYPSNYDITTGTWRMNRLGNGSTARFYLIVKPRSIAPVSNSAFVTSNTTDPNMTDNRDLISIPFCTADLSINKKPSRGCINNTNDTIKFDITVKNNGPSTARGIVIHDSVPNNAKLINSYTKGYDPKTGDWHLNSLSAGKTANFSLEIRPKSIAPINNCVNIISDTVDPNLNNNYDIVYIPVCLLNALTGSPPPTNVTPAPPVYANLTLIPLPPTNVTCEIHLTKIPDRSQAGIGDIITYYYTAENIGNSTITGLYIVDKSDGRPDFELVKIDGNKTVLAPNETASGSLQYKVTESDLHLTYLNNTATVIGKGPHGEYVGDRASASVLISLSGHTPANISYNVTPSYVVVDGSLQENYPRLHEWQTVREGVEDAYKNNIKKVFINRYNYTLNRSIVLDKPLILLGVLKGEVSLNTKENIVGIIIRSGNCELKNISLFNFPVGIDIDHSSNITIDQCSFSGNNGLVLAAGTNIYINANDFRIYRGQDNYGIFIDRSTTGCISNNVFSGDNGILLSCCKGYNITGNDLTQITSKGFKINNCNEIEVYHNNLRSYKTAWIDVDDYNTAQFDCNWWGSLSDNCVGCLSKDIPEIPDPKNIRLEIILDHHPYCIGNEWDGD